MLTSLNYWIISLQINLCCHKIKKTYYVPPQNPNSKFEKNQAFCHMDSLCGFMYNVTERLKTKKEGNWMYSRGFYKIQNGMPLFFVLFPSFSDLKMVPIHF